MVILDPYKDIDYEEINTYEIREECQEKCIEIHEAATETEAWAEYLQEKYETSPEE